MKIKSLMMRFDKYSAHLQHAVAPLFRVIKIGSKGVKKVLRGRVLKIARSGDRAYNRLEIDSLPVGRVPSRGALLDLGEASGKRGS